MIKNIDCIEGMKELKEGSVDSIVTDPPYGLKFMSKDFDNLGEGSQQREWHKLWAVEALRVLKPGGHILAFGGTRTYHHLATALEEAGFEIRDQLQWIYGSGFPKSSNISKAIDKAAGKERPRIPGGQGGKNNILSDRKVGEAISDEAISDEAISDEAIKWDGWGTALKPANEPICLARKPFKGACFKNVLEHGTGGLNIDDCRVGDKGATIKTNFNKNIPATKNTFAKNKDFFNGKINQLNKGRWPSNVIIGEEAGEVLEEQREGAAKFFYCPKASKAERNAGCDELEEEQQDKGRKEGNPGGDNPRNRGLSKRKNHHPTVKPIDLMAYLCRLVTPPGGIVLDPFLGSGTTGIAAEKEGFEFIGFEKEEDYFEIAKARIEGGEYK